MRRISKRNARLVKLEPRHAAIVPYLRRADVEEIWAGPGVSPKIAVAWSIAMSDPGWAVEIDDRPLALFGAQPVQGGVGVPWLVATEEIEKYPVHFFRVSRDVVDVLKERYRYLENRTDARNALSLRWLEWAGFTIEPAEPWGVAGMEFHRFWWRK